MLPTGEAREKFWAAIFSAVGVALAIYWSWCLIQKDIKQDIKPTAPISAEKSSSDLGVFK